MAGKEALLIFVSYLILEKCKNVLKESAQLGMGKKDHTPQSGKGEIVMGGIKKRQRLPLPLPILKCMRTSKALPFEELMLPESSPFLGLVDWGGLDQWDGYVPVEGLYTQHSEAEYPISTDAAGS
jgi:hypothetical protein